MSDAEVDGAELPQVVVDELARHADRVLLPISSSAIPPGECGVVEFTISEAPRFYLVSVVAHETEGAGELWIEEVRVDDQIVARDRCAASPGRWLAMSRPAGPGSRVIAQIVNRGAVTAPFVGGLLIAATEDGPG